MKRFVRPLLLLLCAALLTGLVSCVKIGGGDDVPEGMQNATVAGADYRLYVPTTWVVQNSSPNVSSAYRDLSRQSTVSVAKYLITQEDCRSASDALETTGKTEETAGESAISPYLAWFFENECLRPVRATALDGKVTLDKEASGADMLDKTDAGRWCYSALIGGKTYYFKQLVAERYGAFYVFTFTAEKEMYEQYASDVEKILNAFRFADEPYLPDDFAKETDAGKDAPAGMKACFGDDVAYRFYVPADWVIDPDSPIYAAYVEADRTSVSVVPYMPTVERLSVAEYFTMTREQLEKVYGEGAMVVDEDQTHKEKLGSREATVYEYTLTINGVVYRYRQYIAAYRSMMYSLTYTATEANFDKHTAELADIVAAFAFR